MVIGEALPLLVAKGGVRQRLLQELRLHKRMAESPLQAIQTHEALIQCRPRGLVEGSLAPDEVRRSPKLPLVGRRYRLCIQRNLTPYPAP